MNKIDLIKSYNKKRKLYNIFWRIFLEIVFFYSVYAFFTGEYIAAIYALLYSSLSGLALTFSNFFAIYLIVNSDSDKK